jgi:hypothetical protein
VRNVTGNWNERLPDICGGALHNLKELSHWLAMAADAELQQFKQPHNLRHSCFFSPANLSQSQNTLRVIHQVNLSPSERRCISEKSPLGRKAEGPVHANLHPTRENFTEIATFDIAAEHTFALTFPSLGPLCHVCHDLRPLISDLA